MGTNSRFAVVATLLATSLLLLNTRASNEIIPKRERFADFPRELGNWGGSDVRIPPDVRQVLGSGDFLLRNYQKETGETPVVNLFVAYFPRQQTSDTIHSPKNCLPGGGWFPLESGKIQILLPGQPPLLVNRYLVAMGEKRQLVLYWYWSHNRAVASEFLAKFYLMADSIRLNRSDGALIRVSTEQQPRETVEAAQQRLVSLLIHVMPILEPYIPS